MSGVQHAAKGPANRPTHTAEPQVHTASDLKENREQDTCQSACLTRCLFLTHNFGAYYGKKRAEKMFFQLDCCIFYISFTCVCDEIPVAITACTAEQSFGNISECKSHSQRRHDDYETPQDTFQTFHFKAQRD